VLRAKFSSKYEEVLDGGVLDAVNVFGDNYFSALATITIPFAEVQESSVFESVSVVVVGDPLWARFAASKR
jgi:hypothetical protein